MFGDFVQRGEVGGFDVRRRFLADTVQSASLFGPEPARQRPSGFVKQQEQLLVHESEENVRLSHGIGPRVARLQSLEALHDFRRRAEEEQSHAFRLGLVSARAHVQVGVADDPAEIVVEAFVVLGVEREDVFAEEARPGDVDVGVDEAFSVPEGVGGTG